MLCHQVEGGLLLEVILTSLEEDDIEIFIQLSAYIVVQLQLGFLKSRWRVMLGCCVASDLELLLLLGVHFI